jgi:hypothetical protein
MGSVFIGLLIYSTSGIQYFFVRNKYKLKVNKEDILLLPIVMNLWSFIIPFQGSLIFSTLFFRLKYNIKITDSFAINFYLYLVTVFFAGIVSFIFVLIHKMYFSILAMISILFILSPLILMLLNFILPKFSLNKISFVNKVYSISCTILKSTKELWADKKNTLVIFILNILRTFMCMVWFYWIAKSIGLQVPFLSVALLSIMMDISIIIKFTPDNLGIAQAVSGLIASLTGLSASTGILISLLASATTLIIICTIGIWANYNYMKYFKVGSIKELLKRY